MSVDSNPIDVVPGGNLMLWVGLLGSPVTFLCHLQANYMLVPWACTSGHQMAPRLAWIPFFLAAVVLGLLSCRNWLRLCAHDINDRGIARCRFMAVLGIALSSLFALTILAQGVATFIISPCSN